MLTTTPRAPECGCTAGGWIPIPLEGALDGVPWAWLGGSLLVLAVGLWAGRGRRLDRR